MMERTEEKSVTAQRRETLVPVGEVGEREGPPRPLASILSASQAGNQAGTLATATGTKKTQESSEKQENKERTPTKTQKLKKLSMVVSPSEYYTPGKTPARETQKNITFLDLTWDDEEHKSVKRKRVEDNDTERMGGSPDKKLKRKLRKLLARMEKEVKHLRKVARENQNTKKEIKEIAENLNCITSGIMTTEMQNVMFLNVRDEELGDIKKIKETASIGTQTESFEDEIEIQERETEIEELGEIRNVEEFRKVECKRWKRDLFQCTEIKEGNPLETKAKTVKVVWIEPNDLKMEKSIQLLYKKRFPEILEFEEDYEVIEQTIKRRTGIQENKPVQKIIKIKCEHSDEEVWKYLGKIREDLEWDEEVALHHLESMTAEKMAKMTEVRFRGGKNKVTIYTTKEKRKETENKQKGRFDKTYALIVSSKEEEYEGTMKKIKEKLINVPEKEAIREIRKTREGNLLITLEKNNRALEMIRKEVQKGTSLKVKESGEYTKKCAVHIRGLEVSVTKEEIQKAIINLLGTGEEDEGEIKIGEIRPNAYGTKAVTVSMQEKEANKLVTCGEIRIGLVKCVVEKHVMVERCYGCGLYDHKIEQCKVERKEKVCFRCGEGGHIHKECKGDEKCFSCKKEGHIAGSGKCPLYRVALANTKRIERERMRKNSKMREKKEEYEEHEEEVTKQEMEKKKENSRGKEIE
ncbi:golgin subfamily A member 6-like protein 25 [Euwallacea similis]|uniref:golgin subfamily A member 6-like protein 25 n=1 Tax=Euwallacea similis TaxID=1736056 RepID=UPI00344D7699